MATNSSQTIMALQSAAAVTSAAGAFASARNERVAAKATADYADRQALDAKARGDRAEQELRRKAALLQSTQRAGFGARGVALDEGSPLAVLESTNIMADADVATAKDNAAREAYGFKVKAHNARAAARASNPWIAAGSSLIGSAGSVADKWYTYTKTRPSPGDAPQPKI